MCRLRMTSLSPSPRQIYRFSAMQINGGNSSSVWPGESRLKANLVLDMISPDKPMSSIRNLHGESGDINVSVGSCYSKRLTKPPSPPKALEIPEPDAIIFPPIFRRKTLPALTDGRIWNETELLLVCTNVVPIDSPFSIWWWSNVWRLRLFHRGRLTFPPSLRKPTQRSRREVRRRNSVENDREVSRVRVITLKDIDRPTTSLENNRIVGNKLRWRIKKIGLNVAAGVLEQSLENVYIKKVGNINFQNMTRVKHLTHSNIVTLIALDHDIEPGNIFFPRRSDATLLLFFPYVPLLSLKDMIAERHYTGLSMPLVRSSISNVIEGLIFLHSQGIPHNRLTARNILYDPIAERCMLTDYALFLPVGEDGRIREDILPSCAPEQILDPRGRRVESDIWMLGCLVIELCSGFPPPWKNCHDFDDISRTIALLCQDANPLDYLNPWKPAEDVFKTFCGKCFVYGFSDRPDIWTASTEYQDIF
jgi:hypothetical protein